MFRAMARRNLSVIGLFTVVAALAACGDSNKDPNTGDDAATATATATSTGPEATGPTATATATATTPPEPPKPKGPGKVGPFVASNPKPAKPGVKIAAAVKAEEEGAVRTKLDAAVEKEGEGMAFEGSPAAGKFKQGEVIEITITAQPNKCYTVVAVSDGGITELDAVVLVSPPVPLPVAIPPLATDTTTGPDVTMGGGGNCIKSTAPAAAPATVQVKATKGAGVAAVQVLSK